MRAVAALGRALQARLRRARRASRARRCSASCRAASMPGLRRALRGSAGRHGLSRLRARRPGGRRGPGRDAARRSTDALPIAARGQAALPDGRRHAARPDRGGGARRRHVRLRAADAQRPPRPGLHLGRQGQPANAALRRGCRARSIRRARARPRATIRAPTCTTSSSRGSISAPCCCPGPTWPSTRS